MSSFTPVLPPHWKHVIGLVPIPPDDLRTWDEDIFSAEWRPTDDMKPGYGWWIHLDGGKGLSTWQCTLEIPDPDEEHYHIHLMRDFLETTDEVQAWIDRAVVMAQKSQEQDDAREEEDDDPGQA